MKPNRKRLSRIRRSKRCQFTLVEMLVVIAIICVLAALLMPLLQKAQASVRTVACQNNLKNCFSAAVNYTDDNAGWLNGTGKYPGYVWSSPLLGIPYLGYGNSTKYITDLRTVLCPAFPPAEPYAPDPVWKTYGFNQNFQTFTGECQTIKMKNASNTDIFIFRFPSIKNPSGKIMLADTCGKRWDVSYLVQISIWNHECFVVNSGIHTRHDDRCNILYADGHVRALSTGELLTIGFKAIYTQDSIPITY